MTELDVQKFVSLSRSITAPEELAEAALSETRKLGFEYISASGGALRYPKPEQVLYPGFPPEWTSFYLKNELYKTDPVLKQCVETSMPFEWSELASNEADDEVLMKAEALGLNEGFVVPLQGLNSYTGYVSFCGEAPELSPQGRLDLQIIGIYFHHQLRDLRDASDETSYWGEDLTPRETDCLNLIADGKTNWEVSEILKISEHTVKTHADNMRAKFGVTTRVQIVVEGIRRGYIWN